MKGRDHPSHFTALSFPDWKKTYPFTAGLTERIFQSQGGESWVQFHDLLVTFCTIITAKMAFNFYSLKNKIINSGNKTEGDVGDKVSLQAQTSPYFPLREKFKFIEHIDKTQLKTSPWN